MEHQKLQKMVCLLKKLSSMMNENMELKDGSKKVTSKTELDNAGDGTTTATILAQGIVNEGLKYVTAGMNLWT